MEITECTHYRGHRADIVVYNCWPPLPYHHLHFSGPAIIIIIESPPPLPRRPLLCQLGGFGDEHSSVGQSRIGPPALPRITLKSISSATTSSTGSTSRGWQGCQLAAKGTFGSLGPQLFGDCSLVTIRPEVRENLFSVPNQDPTAGEAEVSSSVNKHPSVGQAKARVL